MEKEIVCLTRDCVALMVPSGARIFLHRGTEVTITQALGDSYTVNIFGNLARIAAQDADALGKAVPDPLADMPEGLSLEDQIWMQLSKVFDPEIPVNIVDLGLVYDCQIISQNEQEHHVRIVMTLTAPGCGMGPVIAEDAKSKVLMLPDVQQAEVEIVFDPPWDRNMMSDTAKLELGMF